MNLNVIQYKCTVRKRKTESEREIPVLLRGSIQKANQAADDIAVGDCNGTKTKRIYHRTIASNTSSLSHTPQT